MKVKVVAVASAVRVAPLPTCWPRFPRAGRQNLTCFEEGERGPIETGITCECQQLCSVILAAVLNAPGKGAASWSPLSGAASERAFPSRKGESRVQKSLRVGGLSEIRISKANGVSSGSVFVLK